MSAIAAGADRTGWQAWRAAPCMLWEDIGLAEGLLVEAEAMVCVFRAENGAGSNARSVSAEP